MVSHHAAQDNGPQRTKNAADSIAQCVQIEQDAADQKNHDQAQQDHAAIKQDLFDGNLQQFALPFLCQFLPTKNGWRCKK